MTTKRGAARYPNRRYADRSPLAGDDLSLGRPMTPTDVYVEVKRLLQLDDDELLQAFAFGAAALADGRAAGHLVEEIADLDAVIEDAATLTRSRLVAWRKRGRQMRWDELRVVLLGLRHVVIDEDTPQ